MSATDWKAWTDQWPDWGDDERRVAIRLKDGQEFEGELSLEDVVQDDEGDEYPIREITLANGTRRTFADNDEWRFLS